MVTVPTSPSPSKLSGMPGKSKGLANPTGFQPHCISLLLYGPASVKLLSGRGSRTAFGS